MRRFFYLGATLCFPVFCSAAYTVKNGRLVATNELATLSVQEHYSLAKDALDGKNWFELVRQSRILLKNFPDSPFAEDGYFYLGMAYFHVGELDLANDHFSSYLKERGNPKFFEEAVRYKFLIAEQFEKGVKRRVLGSESMPKWLSGKRACIEIYDEVIAALPHHDLAVRALYGKGNVLFEEGEFKESIETFKNLLRRFPKSPLARDAYVAITRVYKTMSEKEYADPDFLDLAEINVKKFRTDFPGDPKIDTAESILGEMKEVYALDLYETARFYERTKKPQASVIYYSKIVGKYPGTKTALKSQERLDALLPRQAEKHEPMPARKEGESLLVDASSQRVTDTQ